MKFTTSRLLCILALSVLNVPAAFAVMIFTDETSFLDAAQTRNSSFFYREDFSSVTINPGGTQADFGPVNGYEFSVEAPGGLFSDGDVISTNIDIDELIVMSFTGKEVTAVGGNIWISDAVGVELPGTISVVVSFLTGPDFVLPGGFLSIGRTGFLGFVTEGNEPAIAGLSFTPNTEFVNLDNLFVGQAPEPTSASLILASLFGLLGLRRRQLSQHR